MLGISINIYIYSTVQNIKVLPPVVNKKAVVILNFHGAGEYLGREGGGRRQGGGANDDSIRSSDRIEHCKKRSYIFIHNSDERG